ncbi:hypothetical protein [Streptomyces axinellae]|uniref:Secreted protein n=1 Tax=Streptomyces axinellae TaxID=552788 RepID=A0ABP6CXD4_9ACTN
MRAVTRRHGGTVLAAAVALLATATAPAAAGDGEKWGTPPAGTGDSPSHTIGASVHFKKVNDPGGGTPLAPAGGGTTWEPPTCWYEPRFTPEQFDDYTNTARNYVDSASAYLTRKYGKNDFNKGEKGLWWELQISEADDGSCNAREGYLFIGPEHPAPPDAPVIDPEILAGLAYRETRLPAPPVKLSPAPGHQVVNLKTYASFSKKLERVWVTAGIDVPGGEPLAATAVAEPSRLRLTADGGDADPASCSYDLTGHGGAYAVRTKDADCNITYRRSSGKSTHPLRAYLTWKVHWNAGDGPDGDPQHALPSGETEYETAVTVKEVQSIVRD